MKRVFAMALAPTVASAVLAAGCGSSSSSSTTTHASSASAAGSTSPASSIVITTKHDKLGTVLAAGGKQLTVYMFEADKGSSSNCSGKCAELWPPVIGKPTASGQAVAADLGTTARADGTTQVTYKGHPLYYFAKDKDVGDTYGQGIVGFGAPWHVMSPTGAIIAKAGGSGSASGGAPAKPATSTSSSSSSGGSGLGY